MSFPVFISLGQSHHPVKRELEKEIAGQLHRHPEFDVTMIANLYDLKPDGPALEALGNVEQEMLVFSWNYQRAAHWILDRQGIRGTVGEIELQHGSADDEDELEDELEDEQGEELSRVIDSRPLPERQIYCINLQSSSSAEDFIEEAERIVASSLEQWIEGNPTAEQRARYQQPGNPQAEDAGSLPPAIEENSARRWYPVIDFSRCTNCMECIDFCLFGVYGVDRAETILVEQPDNCRKGCPACSRVCPENAIVFPQHKTPAIAGAPVDVGNLKIDLSLLFGKPEAADVAARERDEQLIMAGRSPVDGDELPLEKRQAGKPTLPADELDALLDELETLE